MTDELLAYLLDDLCPERRADLERRLADEPALRSELERLRECLASSSATGTDENAACTDEPPHDLVTRTCCLVERVHDGGGVDKTAAPVAMSSCGAVVGGASRWSLADYTVCAGVVGVLAMLMMPALRESRDAARRATCQNNLLALGTAVHDFANRHGPQLPPNNARQPMGMLAVTLVERCGFDPMEVAQIFTCPDSLMADLRFASPASGAIPTPQELVSSRRAALHRLLRATSGTAVQAGYVTADGQYHNAMFKDRGGRPFASDAPVVSANGIYIVVHGGQGENVLDEGLAVRFIRSPYWRKSKEHIFKNSAGAPEAGSDPMDVVLIPGDRWPMSKFEKVVPLREGK